LATFRRQGLESADESLLPQIELFASSALGFRLERELELVRASLDDLAHRRPEHGNEPNDERESQSVLEHGLTVEPNIDELLFLVRDVAHHGLEGHPHALDLR